jgi:hypothetical protein
MDCIALDAGVDPTQRELDAVAAVLAGHAAVQSHGRGHG